MHDLEGGQRIMHSAIDMGAYELQTATATIITWTGNGDGTYWNDPANWNIGAIPDPCMEVVIPTGNNVTVQSGKAALGKAILVELGGDLVTDPTAEVTIGN
jgi:hypothetical protein